MEKKRYIKLFAIISIAITILIFDILFSIKQEIDYEQRKQSGNDRWTQVENRIIQIEKEIDTLKEK